MSTLSDAQIRQAKVDRNICYGKCASWEAAACRKRCDAALEAKLNPTSATASKPTGGKGVAISSKPKSPALEIQSEGKPSNPNYDDGAAGKRKMSKTAKIAIGVVALAAIGGAVYYFIKKRK